MKNYLPQVQRPIAAAMAQNLQCSDHDLSKMIKKDIKNIKKVNPIVAEFLVAFAKKRKNLSDVLCAIVVYKMLYSQAEAHEMNEEFI